jgi:hypothetical protein
MTSSNPQHGTYRYRVRVRTNGIHPEWFVTYSYVHVYSTYVPLVRTIYGTIGTNWYHHGTIYIWYSEYHLVLQYRKGILSSGRYGGPFSGEQKGTNFVPKYPNFQILIGVAMPGNHSCQRSQMQRKIEKSKNRKIVWYHSWYHYYWYHYYYWYHSLLLVPLLLVLPYHYYSCVLQSHWLLVASWLAMATRQ